MNKLILSAASLLLFTACNNTTTSNNTENETFKFSASNLSTTTDFVCGMDLDRDDMIADTFAYEGKIYGFCDPGCKEVFAKDPQSYLAQNQE